jgi:hypothetical protein
MASEEPTTPHSDEIIFSARYSLFKVWISAIVVLVPFLWIFFAVVYHNFVVGDYVGATLFCLLATSLLFLVLLDSILCKELIFYHDRVVKTWHIFGQRTIHYSRAKLNRATTRLRWIAPVSAILEVNENGGYLLWQIPISYIAIFFPSDTSKKTEAILDYLIGGTENVHGRFMNSTLPKEAICPE